MSLESSALLAVFDLGLDADPLLSAIERSLNVQPNPLHVNFI